MVTVMLEDGEYFTIGRSCQYGKMTMLATLNNNQVFLNPLINGSGYNFKEVQIFGEQCFLWLECRVIYRYSAL